MAKLSYKEIKAILLIHSKADYTQKEKIKILLGIVDAKKMLFSPIGLQYREALEKIAAGEEIPQKCCFCHGGITSGKGVICDECVAKLNAVVEKAQREHEEELRKRHEEQERLEQERLEQERLEQERLEQERLEQERLEQERLERERKDFEERKKEEAERIEQERKEPDAESGKTVGSETESEPVPEAESGTAQDEPEVQEDTYIVSSYDSRTIREKNGKSFLIIFIIIILIMAALFAGIYFKKHNENKKAAQERASYSTELYSFVGGSYSTLSGVLGKSQPVVDEYTRFFEKSCMSVIYNPNTGKVTYVDQNGIGPLKTTLFGVCVGMTRDEVRYSVSEFGLKKPVSDSDNTLRYEYSKGLDYTIELAVSFVNDKVEMVSAQVKP